MFATTKYINKDTIIKYKLNPFNPGITKVNVIPVKKRIMMIANIKNFAGDFATL